MLNDYIIIDSKQNKPMYQQIYLSIREAIENGNLKKGSKLPSIRKLSADRGISKTTVTGAYDQLCVEGYIVSYPQKGYFVAADFDKLPKSVEITDSDSLNTRYYDYDFSGQSIDEKIIDLAEWKKNIKDIINRNYLLTSYGDVQGEKALRSALQRYALGVRSVNAQESNIVVGAGTQAILYLLCSLIGFGKKVAVEKSGYLQAEMIFKSFDYDIHYFESDKYGVTIDSLKEISPDIILINPNFSGTRGSNMPVTRRLEIIEWARQNSALILEDDYNGELRYSSHPMPCVQNYGTEQTVYIGSFSKVLLPSVRISYMVLPEQLIKKYNDVRELLNQTASKTEQLALASYIRSGKIDAHIRKARRIYLEKSRVMADSLKKHFTESRLIFNETAMYFGVSLPVEVNRSAIDKDLKNNSVRLMPQHYADNEFGVSFSGIPISKIDDGIALISRIIHQNTKSKPAAE